MVAATSQRVPANTADEINEEFIEQLARRIVLYQAHPELIPQRIGELDREWDIERVIELQAPVATLAGLVLGTVTRRRRWYLLSLLAQSMMVVHAVQGYFPTLPLLRRLGLRTQREISAERYALRAIQGAFQGLPQSGDGKSRADQAYEGTRFKRE